MGPRSGRAIGPPLDAHDDYTRAVAWLDDEHLLTGSFNGGLISWDMATGDWVDRGLRARRPRPQPAGVGAVPARRAVPQHLSVSDEDVVAELRGTALFAAAEPARLLPLARHAFLRRFARGQVVCTEGEPSDHLYVVRTGRVRVLVQSPRGEEMTLSVLGPGETIGELSMIDGQPRSASVEALSDAQLVALPAADVRAALRADPALLLAAAAELAATVRRLTGGTADLVFLDLPRRLAKLLLGEARPAPSGVLRVEPGMTQSGLAARLGVTRQTLNRALGDLVRRGWVLPARRLRRPGPGGAAAASPTPDAPLPPGPGSGGRWGADCQQALPGRDSWRPQSSMVSRSTGLSTPVVVTGSLAKTVRAAMVPSAAASATVRTTNTRTARWAAAQVERGVEAVTDMAASPVSGGVHLRERRRHD